jgi:hypothetical protein
VTARRTAALALVTITLRNRSAANCSHQGLIVDYTIKDADGEPLYSRRIDTSGGFATGLAPGRTVKAPAPWPSSGQPGEYTMTATVAFAGNVYPVTATFQLTA